MARRDVLHAAIGGLAAAVGFQAVGVKRALAQEREIAIQRLDSGLHVVTAGGVNSVALSADGGAVLVDGAAATHSDALLRTLAALPGSGNVHTLFNTHWHPEHTGSNERLGRAGAKIIAQENTRLWLTTEITWPWDGSRFEPLPEPARPNATFFHKGELRVGGRTVRYGHIPQAPHTDGDMYVLFEDANVLAVGDAVSSAGWPLIDWWTGGWIGGMVGGLELLLSLTDANTRIVPARGPVIGQSELERHYEMYGTIFERLAELLYGGKGPEEAVAARPTAEFDAQMGPSDEFVRRAFESLWPYLSPDA